MKEKDFPLTKWLNIPQPSEEDVQKLMQALQIPRSLCVLLCQRGIRTFEEAREFFRPSPEHLHDPFLMKDMDKAVERVTKALSKGEKILVYGDYDVDGTTAVALVYSWLRERNASCGYYIPDRYKEGYGISFAGIDHAKENGYSLIIALDCGIKSIDKVRYATERGIDFIICDHHRPGNELPEAAAVLDPKRADCSYPYDELSGCGIGFKLIQALHEKSGGQRSDLLPLLDLVTVSIAADIVPVTGENRTLAWLGLHQLNNNPRPAFRALFSVARLKKEVTITDLVFTAAPRINAAGRIDHGRNAVEMLISRDDEAAMESAMVLQRNNEERRDLDKSITAHAVEMISGSPEMFTRRSTVVYHPDWHKGVVGIVASRLIEQWYKPTIVLTASEGKVTGSARSVRDFDVYEAIEACSDLLIQFGGHKYAAGLTMSQDKVNDFVLKFEEEVSRRITPEQLVPVTEVDMELSLKEIDEKFFRILRQFAPFGPGNMNPVFLLRNVSDRGYAKIVGENHLKCEITTGEKGRSGIPAIGFGMGAFLPLMKQGDRFNALVTLEENEWNGRVTIQLMIKDLSPV